MVGTLEALTVFVFAVIPGYAAVLAYELRSPPLRSRTALAELARILLASVAVWAVAWWLGAEPVIVDLLDSEPEPVDDMTSRVYRLAGGVMVLALVGGAGARHGRRLLEHRGRIDAPDKAWDRLLLRLRKDEQAVLLRIRLRSGGDVFGDFAEGGRADWSADGAGLLLDREAIPDETGRLVFVSGSRGVFVPGDEISSVSVVRHSEIVDEEHAVASDTL